MVGVMEAQAMEIDRAMVRRRQKCGLHLAMFQLHQDRGENKSQRFEKL